MPFGGWLLRRCNKPALGRESSFSTYSLSKNKMIKNIIIGFVIVLLAGCASQKDMPTQAHYLALLPENADLYLRFPVQENQDLASRLVAILAPNVVEKDVQRLTERFAMIYGAVKNKEFSAVATGSFPKSGLGLVLNEKNGWIVTKDKAIPVTGRYYQYKNLPLQMAFPNSSTLIVSPQVSLLLDSFQRTGSFTPTPGESQLIGRFQEISSWDEGTREQSIDFYMADVLAFLSPFLSLGISLPVKDMYGSLTSTNSLAQDGTRLYAVDGYLGLPDSRAMRSALVALRILARTTGMNFVASSQEGDSMIYISGITISQAALSELVSGILK